MTIVNVFTFLTGIAVGILLYVWAAIPALEHIDPTGTACHHADALQRLTQNLAYDGRPANTPEQQRHLDAISKLFGCHRPNHTHPNLHP